MELLDLIKSNLIEDECILTNKQLSETLDVSERTIQRQLKKLQEEGTIDTIGVTSDRRIVYRQETNDTHDTSYDNPDTTNDIDLSTIDEKYHEVFTTDWNQGSSSTMDWKERCRIETLFREYLHVSTQELINSSKKENTSITEHLSKSQSRKIEDTWEVKGLGEKYLQF